MKKPAATSSSAHPLFTIAEEGSLPPPSKTQSRPRKRSRKAPPTVSTSHPHSISSRAAKRTTAATKTTHTKRKAQAGAKTHAQMLRTLHMYRDWAAHAQNHVVPPTAGPLVADLNTLAERVDALLQRWDRDVARPLAEIGGSRPDGTIEPVVSTPETSVDDSKPPHTVPAPPARRLRSRGAALEERQQVHAPT